MVTRYTQADVGTPEAVAFLQALEETDATQVTACEGWTVHELVAHCAAGPAERARVIEAVLVGEPSPPTRGFEEREAPFRALPNDQLRERLVSELQRFHRANQRLAVRAEPTVTFTGWTLSSTELTTHGRSELALHLWDFAGDCSTSRSLLAQPDLTTHALKVFSALPQLQEAPAHRTRRAGLSDHTATYRLRATDDDRDVVIHLAGAHSHLSLDDKNDSPALTTTAAGRLLLLWGRRPIPVYRCLSSLSGDDLTTLTRWLNA
jgi:hypothetical protein